jgi:hypothetical protein
VKFSTENAFVVAIYGAWAVVFWLAVNQAAWLAGWGGQIIPTLWISGILTGFKYWFDRQALERENQQRALIRMLVLCGGKIRNVDPGTSMPMPDDNLPLWVALKANREDWKDYLSGGGGSQFWHESLLHSAGARARNKDLEAALETLDKGITAAAASVEGPQRPILLFDLRKVLLNHAAERFLAGATKQPTALITTVRNLSLDLAEGSAVGIFLDRVAAEIGYKGHLSTYPITWDDIASWLKRSPPTTLDDLTGEAGTKVRMEMPKTLKDALEHDRIYKGGKCYDG